MKISNYIKFFLVAFAIPCIMLASNDDTEVDRKILSHIRHAMRFNQFYPQEKVYLHLDNTGYFKGETIWFKAYVKRCDTDRRTDLSKVLYVELLNSAGDIMERRKLPIINGEAHGDIKVDSIMFTGFYEIRAYTRYMTNWGTNACFSRIIPIFKAPKTEGDYRNPKIDQISYRKRLNNNRLAEEKVDRGQIYDIVPTDTKNDVVMKSSMKIKFYPEGGKILKGIKSCVAFRLTDDSVPLSADCKLVDANGNVLDAFHTDSEGRGVFTITDEARQIVIDKKTGKSRTFEIPKGEDSGCTISLDILDNSKVTLDVYASEDMVGRKLGYVMQHNGKIIRCDTLTAENHRQIQFKRDKLPEGVSQITLFDAYGMIMAERLFFILKQQDTTISIKSNSKNIRPCSKISLSIHSEPNASLSFSAIDAESLVNGSYGNIRTWMLLGSELRGYIHNPEYYLESDDTEHRKATDLLMMTQGWRRYDWSLMVGRSTFDRLQPIEDKLYIFGKVKGKTRRKPVNGIELFSKMFNNSGNVLEGECVTDSLGHYRFDVPDIDGDWNLVIESKLKNENVDYIVGIDRNFTPRARYLEPLESQMKAIDYDGVFRWDTSLNEKQDVRISKDDRVLKNVTVKGKKRVYDRTFWDDDSEARAFSMLYYDCDADLQEIEDRGEASPSVENWLKSKNNFFQGSEPTDLFLLKKNYKNGGDTIKSIADWFDISSIKYTKHEVDEERGWYKLYSDGLTYKNRPVVWIVDNIYMTITGLPTKGQAMIVNLLHCNNTSNNMDMPVSLSELKSVYISEDTRNMAKVFNCPEIMNDNPVILYCYTHRKIFRHRKGVRRTRFAGYNIPSVFQMEDYSVVPPMEDFRRTLYWNPNVKTDKDGNATVEFYNNSSCTEISVSAEGMTEDGKYVYY